MGPSSSQKVQSPTPIFGLCLLWPNGWMDQDATWYRGTVGFGLGHIVLDGDTAPSHGKGHNGNPPFFDPCLLWANGRPYQLLLICRS